MLDRVRGFGVLNPNAWVNHCLSYLFVRAYCTNWLIASLSFTFSLQLYLITFPHFRCSARGIKKNFPCSACASNGKTPSFKITTTTKTPGLKPYYHQSLKTLAAEFLTDAPEVSCCSWQLPSSLLYQLGNSWRAFKLLCKSDNTRPFPLLASVLVQDMHGSGKKGPPTDPFQTFSGAAKAAEHGPGCEGFDGTQWHCHWFHPHVDS